MLVINIEQFTNYYINMKQKIILDHLASKMFGFAELNKSLFGVKLNAYDLRYVIDIVCEHMMDIKSDNIMRSNNPVNLNNHPQTN